MTFELETAGRRSVVHLRPHGTGWIVSVDGKTIAVDAAHVGGRWSLLIDDGGPDRGPDEAAPAGTVRSHEVAIDERGPGELVVWVDGHPVPVSIGRAGPAVARRARDAHALAGPVAIAAPMPGRVVRLLVRQGDAVAARQGLVVVEAMKMENELKSPRAGRVTEIRVGEGASVDARTVLMMVE